MTLSRRAGLPLGLVAVGMHAAIAGESGTADGAGQTTAARTTVPVVCFRVSGICVGAEPAAATTARSEPGAADSTASPSPVQQSLDLGAPAVTRVIPQSEIDALFAESFAAEEAAFEPPPTVKVESTRPAPEVPSGIGALFWAIRHPSQAWRVLFPAPSR
ncbi:MAG: hypothetical protein DIU56_006870 [Pseudomonadota bacterium]